jgi:hypothetical protein
MRAGTRNEDHLEWSDEEEDSIISQGIARYNLYSSVDVYTSQSEPTGVVSKTLFRCEFRSFSPITSVSHIRSAQ